ncbi:MAG: glycosyltransferase family 2 protein [Planctomycetota bacterium]
MKTLVALPVFNEAKHVTAVLNEVVRFADNVLVVDDGSTDDTSQLLSERRDVAVRSFAQNRGYGAALRAAFQHASQHDYDAIVTIDCDHQHEPNRIPQFVGALTDHDMVSGSRYLTVFDDDSAPPEDRWKINRIVTAELNRHLKLDLTDAFCGFKAYRVDKLSRLNITESGYAMPLELWVEAAAAGLRIRELAVPLIYLEEKRSFGGELDHAETRLRRYRDVISRSLQRHPKLNSNQSTRSQPQPW